MNQGPWDEVEAVASIAVCLRSRFEFYGCHIVKKLTRLKSPSFVAISFIGSSLFCVGGLESWGLTRNPKNTTAMTGSISIAHHARLIARLCLRD